MDDRIHDDTVMAINSYSFAEFHFMMGGLGLLWLKFAFGDGGLGWKMKKS